MKKGDCIIVTNNPLAQEKLGEEFSVCFVNGGYTDVLTRVRDMVYVGHGLLTHPLMGSVKPDVTPYRTVAVSKKTDEFSAEYSQIISNSIAAIEKFTLPAKHFEQRILKDLQLVDLSLICSGLEGMGAADNNRKNGGIFF